jgi:hypothetical protein
MCQASYTSGTFGALQGRLPRDIPKTQQCLIGTRFCGVSTDAFEIDAPRPFGRRQQTHSHLLGSIDGCPSACSAEMKDTTTASNREQARLAVGHGSGDEV